MAEEQKDSEGPLSDLYDSTTLDQIIKDIQDVSNDQGSGMDIEGISNPPMQNPGTNPDGNTYNGGPNGITQRQSTMAVHIANRMTRFRYDTELNNRNIGKEELMSIKFINIDTEVFVRVHCVDPVNKKAHPYCLIGDKCKNGLYCEKFHPTVENKSTLSCKATIKIPKRGEYEDELKKRKQTMEKHLGLFSEEMKKAGYWNTNKNVKECKCVALCVEAFYKTGQQMFMLHEITTGLLNAKEGRGFSVHTIRPFAHYCTGSRSQDENMLIVLTADSFIPKGIEIRFQDEEGWYAKAEKPTIIKNVLEVKIPPYKNTELEEAKQVHVLVRSDSKVNLEANPIKFMYKPHEGTVIECKKRKRQDYSNIPQDILLEANGADAKIRMKSHLERRKKISKASATITAPQPSDGSCAQNILPTDPVFDPVQNLDPNFDFLQNLTSTTPASISAVLTPSNVPFTSPTQPGYMDAITSQSMLYGNPTNPNYQSTSSIYQIPVPSPHTKPPISAQQMNMSVQSPQSHLPVQPPSSQFSVSSPQNNAVGSVTSPPPPQSPMGNIGKFKTVAIAGTNQWLLIDQFGKPLLVLGGQNDEVSASEVQELPSMNMGYISSPPQYDMSGSYPPVNQASDMLAINPLSTTTDNDLEVDDAGDSADVPSSVSGSPETGKPQNKLSTSTAFEGSEQADDAVVEEEVDEATMSMEKMSLELPSST
ncbi:uncharacterized protein LOC133182362 [Saccostrea echinata]|uniref:uncharacterized protein LOC133182362 n=1 Tax=Saccostrea echinata TaxID=191078 RepID=UPI002A815405|nr:uncharacterized protein LOC133182362 [Saccostrea echinata]